MAALGCDTTLYSEGMYEDVNKVVWANVLWDPKRDAQAIVEEYSNYYFDSYSGFPRPPRHLPAGKDWLLKGPNIPQPARA